VIFVRAVVDWILSEYPLLSTGTWPDRDEGEIAIKNKMISHHAIFETPCLLAGEVSARVKMCGEDGYLVEECYGMVTGKPKDPLEIARERHIYYKDIYHRINKVKGYISDDEEHQGRRTESYSDWKRRVRKQRQYRADGA